MRKKVVDKRGHTFPVFQACLVVIMGLKRIMILEVMIRIDKNSRTRYSESYQSAEGNYLFVNVFITLNV